ncbi:MAG: trigger factor [Deltaproteobacteria bacterium]|nr:trigger factor [Deltaproteobacteria bacterium]
MGSAGSELTVECTEMGPVIRRLSVEVDPVRVDKAFERAYRDLAKTARIKGFRPGKVPRSVLQRMYGASLPDEIERMLVSETLTEAIEKAEVVPVSEPDIEADRPEAGSVFRYTAQIEVKPEIELPDLSALSGQSPRVSVEDDEIEAELERMRERNAPWVEEPEETVAANGHTLMLDFVGCVDGETFQGGSAKGVDLQLGTGTMVPGFEEQLLGVRSGEDRQIEITFPDDYGSDELNGKDAVFDCHILAVKRREVPALDDEFAKDLGDFETLEDLRARIRDDLTGRRDESAKQALQRSLIDALIEASSFEVPPGVIDRQLQSQLRSMHSQYQGRVPDEVLQEQLGRMQEEGRPAAERRVREAFLFDAIAEAESIEVGEADVGVRLGEMAEAQGVDVEKLRGMAQQQGWLHAVEQELRDQKVFELLVSRARVEEVEADEEAEATEA